MNYFLTFVPGLQGLVKMEIQTKIKKAQINSLLNGLVIFEAQNQEKEIKNLLLADDSFLLLRKFEGLPKNPLRLIVRLLKKQGILPKTLPIIKDFKLLTRVSGKFPFTRKALNQELATLLAKELKTAPNPQSKNEFWFFLRDKLGLLGFKITAEKVKYRTYKAKSIPGSLKPQVAHGLCLLSEPDKKDVFLDPMCGVGTILVERALYFPFQRVLGGDLDQKAIALTKENIKKAKVKVEANRDDATRLTTIETDSIDKLVTNPPWGKTHGQKLDRHQLYSRLLRQFRRVLKPNGILVLLTSEKALFEKLIQDNENHFQPEEQLNVFISGQKAGIYKLRRTPEVGSGRQLGQKSSPDKTHL